MHLVGVAGSSFCVTSVSRIESYYFRSSLLLVLPVPSARILWCTPHTCRGPMESSTDARGVGSHSVPQSILAHPSHGA
eukprot:5493954-Pyramimonas_sp.AAC.1